MNDPTDAIAGLRKWNDDWPHWQFTEHQHDALRLVLDYSEGASTAIDALQARVKELEAGQERSWCTRCGTVTRDEECDCTIHGSCGEPNFVNYADAMQKEASAAHARALRAEQERDEAYERAAKVAESVGRPVGASDGCGTYIPGTSADAARAIRRLAGTEKDGE